MPETLRRLLGGDDFAQTVAKTRNSLTHHTDKLKEGALTGKQLWIATKRLRLVMEIEFLRQMGIQEDTALSNILARSANYEILQRELMEGNPSA